MKRMLRISLALMVISLILVATFPALAVSSGALDAIASAEFIGEAAGDTAGWSVAGAGDVNGDGYDDFLVGAPSNSDAANIAGAVYLVLGGPSGWSLDKNLAQAPIIQYNGEAASDAAGRSVAGAGDVNGDGYDDILVGAAFNNDAGNDAGAAYLVLGSAAPSGGNLSTAIQYSGEAADDHAGISVAGAGDINGDGYDDFLVGAELNDDGSGDHAGAAYLVLGSAVPAGGNLSTAIRYTGEVAGDRAGFSVAGVGDVNGDGHDDILVGAYSNDDNGGSAGAAYLVLGSAFPVSAGLSTAIQYTGEAGNDLAGVIVAGAGDVNGDGFSDFLVGAPGNDNSELGAGAAYLVLGNAAQAGANLSTAIRYTGEAANDFAGNGLAGAGDVNGDGNDDMLIGALENDDGPGDNGGAAYLVLGSSAPVGGNLSETIQYTAEAADDHAGLSLAGAGDVNGDGYADIMVGARNNDGGGNDAGAAYLLFSDALTSGAAPFRHRTRLAGDGNPPPVSFNQPRVKADFTANALTGADVAVTRHIIHPCNNAIRLQMPIWDVESAKLGNNTSLDLRFEYTEGQVGDMDEANLKLYMRKSGEPCSAWTLVSSSAVEVNTNAIRIGGLTDLGQFTIADTLPDPTMIEMSGPIAVAEPVTFWPAAVLMLVAGTGVTILRRRRQRNSSVEGYWLANDPPSEGNVGDGQPAGARTEDK